MIISAKMIDLFNYRRRSSSPVQVGDLQIGGDAPIRIQSMTTTNTNDTEACVEQAEKIRLAANLCDSPHRADARLRI